MFSNNEGFDLYLIWILSITAVWIFHSRRLNKRINNIHEWDLRIVYKDRIRSFEELLKKINKFVAIHQRNLEIYRYLQLKFSETENESNPEIMKNTFNFIEPAYHLQSEDWLERRFKSVIYGTETISHLGPKIWNLLLEEYQEIDSLFIFNRKILNSDTN